MSKRRLPTTAAKIAEWIATFDREASNANYHSTDDLAAAFLRLEEANRWLADARRHLSDRLGRAMGKYRDHLAGAEMVRHPRKEGAIKCIDEEGLWRAVLDTRIVDPETGEVVPQHEVIVMVYGSVSKETGKQRLTGASPAKIEVLGLDPDLFFDRGEAVGWTVQVKG